MVLTHTLEFKELNLSPEDVLSAVHSLFNKVESFVRPSCCFRIFDGKVDGSVVTLLNAGSMQVGGVISGLLKGSTRFALFAATAGKKFQKFQEAIKQEGDMLPIFILDMIGTCIAEKSGEQIEILLEKEIADYRHTHRFSPGYCGWSLTEQKQLFNLLGGNPCGITLSNVCLMTPIKSISGIVGIGEEVNEKQYGCQFCELETCYKRKNKD